jgi:hypothetical protein
VQNGKLEQCFEQKDNKVMLPFQMWIRWQNIYQHFAFIIFECVLTIYSVKTCLHWFFCQLEIAWIYRQGKSALTWHTLSQFNEILNCCAFYSCVENLLCCKEQYLLSRPLRLHAGIFSLSICIESTLCSPALSLFPRRAKCKTRNTIVDGWRFMHAFTWARAIIDTWWGVRKRRKWRV